MTRNLERRHLFPGALELMIMHSLRLKPMHGYALAKHIKNFSNNHMEIEEGSLYPALQRLLKAGFLESEAGISMKGRPTRIYRLTASGIRRLEHEVSSFQEMLAGILRVLSTVAEA
jgi:PadR family transcriptional regulator PadR